MRRFSVEEMRRMTDDEWLIEAEIDIVNSGCTPIDADAGDDIEHIEDADGQLGFCERCGYFDRTYSATMSLPRLCGGCYEAMGYLDLEFDDLHDQQYTDYAAPLVKAMPEICLRYDERRLIGIGQHVLRYYLHVLRRRPDLHWLGDSHEFRTPRVHRAHRDWKPRG